MLLHASSSRASSTSCASHSEDADLVPARGQEGKGHRAADENGFGAFAEAGYDADLVCDLRASEYGDERPRRVAQQVREHLSPRVRAVAPRLAEV